MLHKLVNVAQVNFPFGNEFSLPDMRSTSSFNLALWETNSRKATMMPKIKDNIETTTIMKIQPRVKKSSAETLQGAHFPVKLEVKPMIKSCEENQ